MPSTHFSSRATICWTKLIRTWRSWPLRWADLFFFFISMKPELHQLSCMTSTWTIDQRWLCNLPIKTELMLRSSTNTRAEVSPEVQSVFVYSSLTLWTLSVTVYEEFILYFILYYKFSFVWFDCQLDQLVIDSAMEKREMEHKHATIQQRVSPYFLRLFFMDQRRVLRNNRGEIIQVT